ncbi:YfiR family protein [Photobacterium japonica]|uniref:YfiR family protein n=1 Tax=Photobacterium japonica TaxID=2910235 RepID=UPI003D109E09
MNFTNRYKLLFYIVSLWGLTIWPAQAESSAQKAFSEHKIKAVYIYRLASFIRWNNGTQTSPRFCVIGRDSTTVTLEKLFAKSSSNKALLSMTNLTEASEQCDLLYVTESKLQLLQTLPQYPGLLTISDSTDTLHVGGMIELRTLGQQVKPVLSLSNIEKANLSVSSQLMRIAIVNDPKSNSVGGSL